jgi:DNA invertase Pin-like site-specific DNA recombinase
MNNEKIRRGHQERTAVVYVRQSSMHQVRHNLESQRRQDALAELARQLGFATVTVIDEDQGCSGSGAVERSGQQFSFWE